MNAIAFVGWIIAIAATFYAGYQVGMLLGYKKGHEDGREYGQIEERILWLGRMERLLRNYGHPRKFQSDFDDLFKEIKRKAEEPDAPKIRRKGK